MAQPPGDGAAGLREFLRGQKCFVEALVFEWQYGDSCVLMETGDKGRVTKFWVPTKRLHHERDVALFRQAMSHPEIPDYTIDDALCVTLGRASPIVSPAAAPQQRWWDFRCKYGR